MNFYSVKFTNELGNEIEMELDPAPTAVTVRAVGPDSTTEHTWTIGEARELSSLLRNWLVELDKSTNPDS